jgi:hypothetical protein
MLTLLCVTDTGQGHWGPGILLGSSVFYCQCDFADKDIPKTAGFRWHPVKKVWWTHKKAVAATLADYTNDPMAEWAKELSGLKMGKEPGKKTMITECPFCGKDGEPVIDHKR